MHIWILHFGAETQGRGESRKPRFVVSLCLFLRPLQYRAVTGYQNWTPKQGSLMYEPPKLVPKSTLGRRCPSKSSPKRWPSSSLSRGSLLEIQQSLLFWLFKGGLQSQFRYLLISYGTGFDNSDRASFVGDPRPVKSRLTRVQKRDQNHICPT